MEKYTDNPSTHPNLDSELWLEAGFSDGSNRNRMYRLSNTTTENLQMTCIVLTVGDCNDFEHSNSRVRDNIRPTSTYSDNPS